MKLYNKRPIFLFAVTLLSAIILFVYNPISNLRIAFLCVSITLFVVSVILYIFSKKLKYIFRCIAIITLGIIVAVSSIFISEKVYYKDNFNYNGYAVVSARISDAEDYTSGNRKRVILDSATIVLPTGEQIKIKQKLSIVFMCDGETDKLVPGNVIDFTAKVSNPKLYYAGANGYTFFYKNKNISVIGYSSLSSVSVVDSNKLTLSERVREKVKQIVNANMDKEYAGLAMGMLFGDRDFLDGEVKADFSATGITHLLAVSGLHVGFLLGFLILLCKLIKIKGIYKFVFCTVILLFYAYLCGFSVSVTRATIMAICFLYAGVRYKRYDSLNSLSTAAIILLLYNPFNVARLGFRLSFMAVFSIVMLAPIISSMLEKIFKPKLASTIAVMLSVQIGLTSLIIIAFNNVTLLTVVANFVSIPIAAIAYEALFATVITSLIIPPLGFSVYLFQPIMSIVVKFVHLLAPLKTLYYKQWQGLAICCIVAPAAFVSSNYMFLNKKYRLVVCSTLWSIVALLLLL